GDRPGCPTARAGKAGSIKSGAAEKRQSNRAGAESEKIRNFSRSACTAPAAENKKAETPSAEALPFCCPMQLWLSCGRDSAAQQYRTRTGAASAMPVQNKNPGPVASGFVLVDGTGLEPVTSCTSSRCSTS